MALIGSNSKDLEEPGYEINFQILLAEFSFEKEKAIAKSLSQKISMGNGPNWIGPSFCMAYICGPLGLEWQHFLRFMGRVFDS